MYRLFWEALFISHTYIFDKFSVPANPARPAAEPEQIIDGGNKETCEKFDNDIISCINGICTNFSNVYR